MKKIGLLFLILASVFVLTACDDEPEMGPYNEGVYFAIDQQSKISVHIVVGSDGKISNILFDKQYGNTTLNTLGDEYELSSGNSWKEEANYLASSLLLDQGWSNIELVVADITGLNSLTAPDYFITIDYEQSPENISFVTIPMDGFVLSWNKAIAKASNDNTGVVLGVPTSDEWLTANMPPYKYKDGIYYADDEFYGYFIRLIIEDGFIVDVTFDAITAVNTRIAINNNGTPDDPSDDIPYAEIISMTTKLSLADELIVLSGKPWYEFAELFRDAIIDKQTWDPNWQTYIVSSHEYFDLTDQYTADDVAGVTIGVEGFRSTFEDAISQAIIEE